MESFTVYLLAYAVVVAICIKESSCSENSAVGFKRLGNYYITETNKNSPNEKIYFLSVTFRANWMAAQSFCKSYGMDLLALESEHEADYFLASCEKSFESFEELSHIGGVSNAIGERENWFWITSHKKVNFDLKLKENKTEKKSEQNCLQLVKQKTGFSYGRTNCFGSELKKFVCQKINVSKLDLWSTIMGR